MLTLFTDLDHTMIYSHRSKPDVDCIQVETMNNNPQSFMTVKTWKTITELVRSGKLKVIPVTTRTKEQYDRLSCLTESLDITDALICNGAVLLKHGAAESRWLDESVSIAENEMRELHKAKNELQTLCGEEKTHFPFEIMAYGVTDNVKQYVPLLRNTINQRKCMIGHDRRKIYCIPASLNKGAAVKRFRERFTTEKSLAVGDSEFDVSMFYEADYAVFPKSLLRDDMSCMYFPVDEGKILSDTLCDVLLNIIE